MKQYKLKKPSLLGKGKLGQQSLGQRVAKPNHSNKSLTKQHHNYDDLPSATDFYSAEIVAYRETGNGWATGLCPFHNDNLPSFAMNLTTGSYFCRSSSCDASGGGIVSFVSRLHAFENNSDAIDFLSSWS